MTLPALLLDSRTSDPRTRKPLRAFVVFRVHVRHTFAVAAVQKGLSLPALQRLLGHDRLTTTEIYWNLSPEDVIRKFRENMNYNNCGQEYDENENQFG